MTRVDWQGRPMADLPPGRSDDDDSTWPDFNQGDAVCLYPHLDVVGTVTTGLAGGPVMVEWLPPNAIDDERYETGEHRSMLVHAHEAAAMSAAAAEPLAELELALDELSAALETIAKVRDYADRLEEHGVPVCTTVAGTLREYLGDS